MLLIWGFIRTGAACVNLIPTTYTFALGRFVAGMFCGIGQIYVPQYLNEIAPDAIRGKVTILFGISFTIGQCVALGLGIPLGFGVSPWFWMLVFGFPIVVQLSQAILFATHYKHDSALWLVTRNRIDSAKKSIDFIYKSGWSDDVLKKLINPSANKPQGATDHSNITVKDYLCDKRYNRIIIIGCFIQVFNIMTGINCIFFYSNLLFQNEGESDGLARILSTALGIWKLATTFLGMPFVDRFGRRPLLLAGCLGMAIFEAFAGLCIFYNTSLTWQLIGLCLFILFFTISVGPVGWVVCSEIMTMNGFFIANLVNWACLGVVIAAFPFMIQPEALGIPGSFWTLAGVALIAFFFVLKFVPETKGMDKSEIMDMLINLSVNKSPTDKQMEKFESEEEHSDSFGILARQ